MKRNGIFVFLILVMNTVFINACKQETLPTLTTASVSGITVTTATSGGDITDEGSSPVIARGVCWDTVNTPTIDDNNTIDGLGIGSFSSTLTSLSEGVEYHLCAYATNSTGTSYGNELTFTTQSNEAQFNGQIIADHTVVDKFRDIPQKYLERVKEMWLVIAGESHSRGYLSGLIKLESLYPEYAVSVKTSSTPESYTDSNLRASRATWGDLNNDNGWVYSYGEEDWWTSETAISRTKDGITYCNKHDLFLGALGFGWCYDPDIDINDYLVATQEYIDFCKENGYPTKVFFTTGPIEGIADRRCYNFNRWPLVREYVAADSTRVLFDYADILCYDDDGMTTTKTCSGNIVLAIAGSNYEPTEDYHISEAGSIRLAKAMWWMLARMAGWDGN